MITQEQTESIRNHDELASWVRDLGNMDIATLVDAVQMIDRVFGLGAQLENHHEYTELMMLIKASVDKDYAEEIYEHYGVTL